MLRMRLQRRGKKNYATYRVVVADQRAPIKGKFLADVGHYNPHTDEFSVQKDSVTEWIGKGVQPTPTVHNLLVEHKVITGEKMTSWRPKVKEASEEEASEGASEETAPEEEKKEETPEAPAEEENTDEKEEEQK